MEFQCRGVKTVHVCVKVPEGFGKKRKRASWQPLASVLPVGICLGQNAHNCNNWSLGPTETGLVQRRTHAQDLMGGRRWHVAAESSFEDESCALCRWKEVDCGYIFRFINSQKPHSNSNFLILTDGLNEEIRQECSLCVHPTGDCVSHAHPVRRAQ